MFFLYFITAVLWRPKRVIPLVVSLLLVGSGPALAAAGCCVAVEASALQVSRDDLGGAGLTEAIAASLRFLQHQKPTRVYRFCDREYGPVELAASLTDFLALANRNYKSAEFDRQIAERFEVCAATGPEGDGKVLVTGYFEPLLEGSLRPEKPFLYPLYTRPPDLGELDGRVGLVQNGQLRPYPTRAQIENEGLLAGQELVYLDDPVEAFILHVQGSGRVRLRDGRIRRVQFAAKNGAPYRSIGKLLVERGKMALAAVNLPAIITYLNSHPGERKDILQYNQSFVFFRWGDDEAGGPLGSLGQPLTAGRSVALDDDCFPPGALGFLKTRKPIFNGENDIVGWAPLQRFVVNQDSGSAIRGGQRLDLFLGIGERARATAGIMKHPGQLYFLIKKK